MISKLKKNLWSTICAAWALIIALFWFAMRVIWSGISKVISEAFGEKEPSTFMLELPLYISVLLWNILLLAVLRKRETAEPCELQYRLQGHRGSFE